MLLDQATQLRNLARDQSHEPQQRRRGGVRLVLVAGGKGGVGTTTVAVNLAVAFATEGHRVVLVDADLETPDVAALTRVDTSRNVRHLLRGDYSLHEVLVPGPRGIQVAPGAWAETASDDDSTTGIDRLAQALLALDRHTDLALIDIGSGVRRASGRWWQWADEVLLTTTSDDVAVMDTYATIKRFWPLTRAALRLLVNQSTDEAQASEAAQRLVLACRRFLGAGLEPAGHLMHCPQLDTPARPLACQLAQAPLARQLEAIVRAWNLAPTTT